MSKWAHFLHALGIHRWKQLWNPPAFRVRGGWVLKWVCKDCDEEKIINTWME